jgi:AbrB family looped-hinge helix DNA binding protein
MKIKIRKVGDEHGVVIPKRMLLALGLKSGDRVDIAANDGKLFVSRSERRSRAGREGRRDQ